MQSGHRCNKVLLRSYCRVATKNLLCNLIWNFSGPWCFSTCPLTACQLTIYLIPNLIWNTFPNFFLAKQLQKQVSCPFNIGIWLYCHFCGVDILFCKVLWVSSTVMVVSKKLYYIDYEINFFCVPYFGGSPIRLFCIGPWSRCDM